MRGCRPGQPHDASSKLKIYSEASSLRGREPTQRTQTHSRDALQVSQKSLLWGPGQSHSRCDSDSVELLEEMSQLFRGGHET